jgi:hypothetical protein
MKPLKEEEKTFTSSPGSLATNSLRLACRHEKSQGGVWANVVKAQMSLSKQAGASVADPRSDSSLALSLDAKQVAEASQRYVTKLSGIVADTPGVVGYVFAVNDRVVASDAYGSRALFQKVWPRLLKANAIEAFAELKADRKYTPPDAKAFQAFLRDAAMATAKSSEVAGGLRQVTREGAGCVLFESRGMKKEGLPSPAAPLRVNVLAK